MVALGQDYYFYAPKKWQRQVRIIIFTHRRNGSVRLGLLYAPKKWQVASIYAPKKWQRPLLASIVDCHRKKSSREYFTRSLKILHIIYTNQTYVSILSLIICLFSRHISHCQTLSVAIIYLIYLILSHTYILKTHSCN